LLQNVAARPTVISRVLLSRTVAGKVVFDVEEWQDVVMLNSYGLHDAEDSPTPSDPAVLRHGDDGRG
jgi:hypothetical protein